LNGEGGLYEGAFPLVEGGPKPTFAQIAAIYRFQPTIAALRPFGQH
jgi:hypothetical protein